MTAGDVLPSQLLVVVERDAARMRMRLIPAGDGGERAAVVNRGLGIVPLEILGSGDVRALAEVYHAFRALDLGDAATSGDDRLDLAFAAWGAALARAGIALRLERRALYGAPLPRQLWGGAAHRIWVRPSDIELTALAAGLRRIVKLDNLPVDLAERLGRDAAGRGFRVEIVAPEGPMPEAAHPSGAATLLIARDGSVLIEARALEASLLARGGPDARASTLRMGELLGYPRCCAERFTRIAAQNDTTLAWALLPGLPHASAPPHGQWLQPGLSLLSHAPCDLQCDGTVALGERVLATLDAAEPGFAVRWRALTSRVQVVDHRGNALALVVDGRLDAGATVVAADLLSVGGADADATDFAQRLVARTVRCHAGGLVVDGGGWYAPYVADHRGGA